MLRQRLIFGSLMIVGLLVVLYLDAWLDQVSLAGTFWQSLFLGRAYLPAGLILVGLTWVLILLATPEIVTLFRAKGIEPSPVMIAISGLIGCSLIYIIPSQTQSPQTLALYATLIVLVFMFSLIWHSWGGRTQGAVIAASVVAFAIIYLGAMPGFYLAIRRWHSIWIIAAIIIIAKNCDSGAYFTGRAIGRHKLIPWLSPGKTWEGLFGGLAASGLTAVVLVAIAQGIEGQQIWGRWSGEDGVRSFQPYLIPLWLAAIMGIVIGLIGQMGDLTASLFKRDAGIKDSGKVIPGFGGVLDVLDSPIVVAPLAYWLLELTAWVSRLPD